MAIIEDFKKKFIKKDDLKVNRDEEVAKEEELINKFAEDPKGLTEEEFISLFGKYSELNDKQEESGQVDDKSDLISKFNEDPHSLDEDEFVALFGGLSELCD